ncbi:MAG: prenyltransferase/squalene oxidase repeat-containing protein, partial [Planctomycetota bacterium]
MPNIRRTRGAMGAAATLLLVAGCETQPSVIVEAPRDVRVVEISDEVAEMIAERVAAYIPKAPQTYRPPAARKPTAAAVPIRVTPPSPQVGGPAVYSPPASPEIFSPAADVAADRLERETRAAIDKALEWLAEHQAPDGSWQAAGFTEECQNQCDAPGEALYTPGLTGMAVLCFLGDGQTHRSGDYKENVEKALRYLRSIQDSEGCFGPRVSQHFQYNHAAAALAMVEIYAMTKSPIVRESAQAGVNFVMQSQNPYLGWRYGVRDGDNDTSMTCRMTEVLYAARAAGLQVDDNAFRGALSWVEKMTEPEFGRVGYNRRGGPTARTMEAMDAFPAEMSEAMTAAGLLVRLYAGQAAKANESIQKGADLLAARPPV